MIYACNVASVYSFGCVYSDQLFDLWQFLCKCGINTVFCRQPHSSVATIDAARNTHCGLDLLISSTSPDPVFELVTLGTDKATGLTI